MKRVFVMLALVASTAMAEPVEVNKVVVCDDKDTMLEHLNVKYGETPYWIGAEEDEISNVMLMVNTETQSWSLVQFTDRVSCLINSGTNFKFRNILPTV